MYILRVTSLCRYDVGYCVVLRLGFHSGNIALSILKKKPCAPKINPHENAQTILYIVRRYRQDMEF